MFVGDSFGCVKIDRTKAFESHSLASFFIDFLHFTLIAQRPTSPGQVEDECGDRQSPNVDRQAINR